MKLTVNGEKKEFPKPLSIAELLDQLKISSNIRVAVALNGQVIPKKEHPNTPLKENDVVEIVRMVGGG